MCPEIISILMGYISDNQEPRKLVWLFGPLNVAFEKSIYEPFRAGFRSWLTRRHTHGKEILSFPSELDNTLLPTGTTRPKS